MSGGRSDSTANVRSTRARAAPIVALVLLVAVVFGRAATFDFCLYDDPVYVSDNPRVLKPSWPGVVEFWTTPYHGVYIPLGYSLYVGTSEVAQRLGFGSTSAADARPFHLVCIVFHAINTVFVYLLLGRLEASRRSPVRSSGTIRSRSTSPPEADFGGNRTDLTPWYAAFGAALFAVHPLQVESVAWVSGIPGVLGAALALAAVLVYLDAVSAPGADRGESAIDGYRYAVATVLFGLALLAKPLVVTIPLVLLALDVGWFRRPARSSLARLAPWLALAAVITVVTRSQQPLDMITFATPWALRPLVALDALGFYLVKFVWPFALGPDHGRTPALVTADLPAYALTLALPLVVVAMAAVLRVSRRTWLAGAVALAALLPVLGLTPFAHQNISTVADRYAYLALIGPAWLLAVGLSRTAPRYRAWGPALLVAWTAIAVVQTGYWRNGWTLAEHTLALNPASWQMIGVKATVLADQGRTAEATACYEEGVARSPRDPNRHRTLGQWRHNHGDFLGAIACFQRALDLLPASAPASLRAAYLNVAGMPLESLRRIDEASDYFRRALAIDPNYQPARLSLARMLEHQGRLAEAAAEYQQVAEAESTNSLYWTKAGLLWMRVGRAGEAEAALRHAIAADPQAVEPQSHLATLLLQTGRSGEAFDLLRSAARLAPDQPTLRINLASALIQANQLAEAEAELRGVLAAHPQEANAHYNLGALLARRGDHLHAVDEFRAALAVNGKLAAAQLSLSVSLGALGRLDEAITECRAAVALAPNDPLPHHQLALLWEQQGQISEAIAELRKTIELAPNYEPAQRDLKRLEATRP